LSPPPLTPPPRRRGVVEVLRERMRIVAYQAFISHFLHFSHLR